MLYLPLWRLNILFALEFRVAKKQKEIEEEDDDDDDSIDWGPDSDDETSSSDGDVGIYSLR